jgi:hypothetical protein
MSDQKFSAIPTVYKGVQFRSRLEARWAAYFQLCKEPWAYEPVELKGYIPDFIIGEGVMQRLVEVKPARTIKECVPACRKIQDSGWNDEAMVVGVDPTIGVIRMMVEQPDMAWERVPGHWIVSLTGEWSWESVHVPCVVCGRRWEEWNDLWVEAGNLTQYKSPRKR